MKNKWLKKYQKAAHKADFDSNVLLGFNANIDVTTNFSKIEADLEEVEEEELRKVKSEEDFLKVLKHCRENETNLEVDSTEFDAEVDGDEQIGGQAGIMSNFLSGVGHRAVIYTPFLSQELAEKIHSEVLYPTVEDGMVLKSVSDAVNSDRTKKNYIVEFEEESCRLILSDHLRGFGPYFRKGMEEKFPVLQDEIDRAIFSGFHDIRGNFESKLRKSEKQLRKLHVPKHLEFVSTTPQKDEMILEKILPYFTSVGMDESELHKISDIMGYEIDEEPSLGDVYTISKKMIQKYDVERVHVHTKNFQSVVAESSYPVRDERIRKSILFSGLSAVSMAETGEIPEPSEIELETDRMHITKLDDLEHFEDFFDLDDFAETGIARLEGYKVVAAPTIIHEEPKRLVGMGDIISSGAFTAEVHPTHTPE
ncbi:MAG: ADP-dependent glucokinase/phosphofructokinase [Candidatus Nanohalobium sp.]